MARRLREARCPAIAVLLRRRCTITAALACTVQIRVWPMRSVGRSPTKTHGALHVSKVRSADFRDRQTGNSTQDFLKIRIRISDAVTTSLRVATVCRACLNATSFYATRDSLWPRRHTESPRGWLAAQRRSTTSSYRAPPERWTGDRPRRTRSSTDPHIRAARARKARPSLGSSASASPVCRCTQAGCARNGARQAARDGPFRLPGRWLCVQCGRSRHLPGPIKSIKGRRASVPDGRAEQICNRSSNYTMALRLRSTAAAPITNTPKDAGSGTAPVCRLSIAITSPAKPFCHTLVQSPYALPPSSALGSVET